MACGREGCSRSVRQRAGAALGKGELAGAACGGARGFDEIGGEAARFVDSACGLGRELGRRLEIEVKCHWRWLVSARDARSACGNKPTPRSRRAR